MSAPEGWMLVYLLNSLWQVPVIFAAGWIAARMARRSGPELEHRVWVVALLLQVLLPACRFRPGGLIHEIVGLILSRSSGAGGEVRVAIGTGVTSGLSMAWLSNEVLTAVLVVYGCSVLYFAARLGWRMVRTRWMERQAKAITLTGDAMQRWERCGRVFGRTGARVAESDLIGGPVTVGVRSDVMLVPPGFLESIAEEDLDVVMAHEFAHMRRRDVVKNLIYEVLSLPVAYHPALWLTRARVAESREMVCDAMAAEAVAGSERYARSLLRLASLLVEGAPDKTLHAIGIFDANSFERRVMRLSEGRVEMRGVRRLATIAACGMVGLVTCASALGLRMEVPAPATATAAQDASPVRLTIPAQKMDAVYKRPPVYPQEAKAKKDTLNGPVVLDIVVDEAGVPSDVRVRKGLRSDYDESALQAVKEWRWNPYLLNGRPVTVNTTVTVNYFLGK
ncbi:TonB family protein [Tunturiibacter psychrotolerans]|uniref:TonB family protein n=1 Tax=Tunturiibacter psychrotolerans TaxID=3069686 RepID=UPI003D1A5BF3